VISLARPRTRCGEVRVDGVFGLIEQGIIAPERFNVRDCIRAQWRRRKIDDEDVPAGDPLVAQPTARPPQVQPTIDAWGRPYDNWRLPADLLIIKLIRRV